jgi:hypothetical protein
LRTYLNLQQNQLVHRCSCLQEALLLAIGQFNKQQLARELLARFTGNVGDSPRNGFDLCRMSVVWFWLAQSMLNAIVHTLHLKSQQANTLALASMLYTYSACGANDFRICETNRPIIYITRMLQVQDWMPTGSQQDATKAQ